MQTRPSPPGRFVRQIASVVTGTAIGQALLVLVTPLLTRLYDPVAFGAFAVFAAFLGFASVGLSGRLEMLIPSARSESRARGLTWLCCLLVVPVSVVAAAGYAALVAFGLLGFGALPAWSTALMFVALVATGVFTALRFWHVRRMNFATIGGASARQGAGRALAPVALGLATSTWSGLALGDLAGRLLGIRSLARDAWPALRALSRAAPFGYARALLRHYARRLGVLFPSSLIDAAAAALAVPLFASLYGLKAAGEVALVMRLASAPSALLGGAIADVFHAHFPAWLAESRQRALSELRRNAIRLGAVGLAIFGPACALAPFVFGPGFGAEWRDAGVVLATLFPALVLAFVVSPLSRAIVAADRLELKLVADVSFLLLPPLVVWLCRGRPFMDALLAFSLTQTALFAVYGGLIWAATRSPRAARAGATQPA
jgi:O-antigen/teichoic acid export membrane protein